MSAAREAAEATGPEFDHETWAYVLLELLVPHRSSAVATTSSTSAACGSVDCRAACPR